MRLHTNRGDLNLELHCDMVGVGSPATGFLSCHLTARGWRDGGCSRQLLNLALGLWVTHPLAAPCPPEEFG